MKEFTHVIKFDNRHHGAASKKPKNLTDHMIESAPAEVRKKYKSTSVMLGKGAFGTVVQFIERDTNKKVAIKILLKERLSEQEMNFVQ
jgi:hypothetical protein